jgi:pimeloyl-ACP methyl ester carboxylesterase
VSAESPQPEDLFVEVRGLRLHVAAWGPRAAPPLLLLHGYQDHARLFDGLARRLVAGGQRVLALDLRGHGDSDHVGAGGAYHFADYVADLHGVLAALVGGEPARLVGHSLGGAVVTFYAGAFPERVSHLGIIEALGPHPHDPSVGPDRMHGHAEDILRLRDAPGRSYPTVAAAAERVLAKNPRIRPDDALHYARHGTRPVGDGFVWKFDPRLHARQPYPWLEEMVLSFLMRIQAPVLFMEGSRGMRLPPEARERRLGRIARVEAVLVEDAGHHVHLDAPDAVAGHLLRFLAS